MRHSRVLRITASLFSATTSFGQDVLYHIDVVGVVCNESVTVVNVTSPTEARRAAVHVPVLYRTSSDMTSVNFSLVDAAGRTVVDSETSVLLVAAPGGRRLDAAEPALQGTISCDDLFLLDGRPPVEIPDTWGEARAAFVQICTEEVGESSESCSSLGRRLFEGTPSEHDGFAPGPEFCSRLAEPLKLSTLTVRRLKGSSGGGQRSTSSGAPAVGAFSNNKQGASGQYGYSATALGTRFPKGHTPTGYGFSGRGGALPYVAGGLVAFWVVSSAASNSAGYRGDQLQTENASSAASCAEPFKCSWKNIDGEEIIRDELMGLGFKPASFSYPLQLRVSNIVGPDFARSRICPPSDANSTSNLTNPLRKDLFFALSEVEPVTNPEEESVWNAFTISILVVSLLIVGFGGAFVAKRWVKRRLRQQAQVCQARVSFAEADSAGIPIADVVGRDTLDVKDVSVEFEKSAKDVEFQEATGQISGLGAQRSSSKDPMCGGCGAWLLFGGAGSKNQPP